MSEDLEQQLEYLKRQISKQERLASLGLLSAGIAHEIQNPLNFVINFSKLSGKLLEEMADLLKEAGNGLSVDLREEMEEILQSLQGNMQKIEENGNRASSIVKGILLYSRGKDDLFMPTDLQRLVHEYIWLSYHAMRANHRSFNVAIEESYEEALPLVSIVPQDISRAVLNIMNNACYSVFSRSQRVSEEPYSPVITIRLWREEQWLYLSIEDNGIGIPDEVLSSLFTPFFTTKPVGEGTGLGLSISKSIVEEKHGGRIEVLTEVDRFSRFTIVLPLKQ